ncbi:hypothetical protein [uncultured Croceitalea sp.]|uniref:hypothetical protein n=1 Tax=uncultured Croceitalea sp. TaxID=1798908 RepID=UPI003305D8E8
MIKTLYLDNFQIKLQIILTLSLMASCASYPKDVKDEKQFPISSGSVFTISEPQPYFKYFLEFIIKTQPKDVKDIYDKTDVITVEIKSEKRISLELFNATKLISKFNLKIEKDKKGWYSIKPKYFRLWGVPYIIYGGIELEKGRFRYDGKNLLLQIANHKSGGALVIFSNGTNFDYSITLNQNNER